MDSAAPENPNKLQTLKQAAQRLAVTIDDLLKWNKQNILKPTISKDGELGYTQEQISKFLKNANPKINTGSTNFFNQKGASFSQSRPSKINLYQKFVNWAGNGFYNDEYIKDYF